VVRTAHPTNTFPREGGGTDILPLMSNTGIHPQALQKQDSDFVLDRQPTRTGRRWMILEKPILDLPAQQPAPTR
jgi:hypothetical protein